MHREYNLCKQTYTHKHKIQTQINIYVCNYNLFFDVIFIYADLMNVDYIHH